MLVLAPHPDDAEIAAFGIYANRRSTVVTVTAGNAGAPTYEAVFDDLAELYCFKGRIRLIDSITVPLQGGIPPDRTFNMGYFDARVAAMYEKRDEDVPEMYRQNSDINVYRTRKRRVAAAEAPARFEVEPSRRRYARVAEEGEAGGHRRAASAARHASRSSVHDRGAVGGAGAVEESGDAPALHQPRRSRSLSVRSGGDADVASATAARGEVAFDRVYSHPVPASLQRLKLFALESMHDLRYTPSRQYQLARPTSCERWPWRKQAPSPTSHTCAAPLARTSCSMSTTATASVR